MPTKRQDGETCEDLLAAARRLGPPGSLRPATFETLFGLMTSTSLRVSGDIHLRDADVDLEQRTLRVIALWLGHEGPTTRLSRLGDEGTCPGGLRIPTIVTACTDERDRTTARAEIGQSQPTAHNRTNRQAPRCPILSAPMPSTCRSSTSTIRCRGSGRRLEAHVGRRQSRIRHLPDRQREDAVLLQSGPARLVAGEFRLRRGHRRERDAGPGAGAPDNQLVQASQAGGASSQLTNAGKTLNEGVEVGDDIDLGGGFSVGGNYTWLPTARLQSTRIIGGADRRGNRLPYAPEHLLNTSLRYAAGPVHVGLSANYVSEQFSDFENTRAGSVDGKRGEIEARTVWDRSASYQLTAATRLYGTVRNLTDEKYIASRAPEGIFPGIERTVELGLKVDL
jgi:hypothetical protein